MPELCKVASAVKTVRMKRDEGRLFTSLIILATGDILHRTSGRIIVRRS